MSLFVCLSLSQVEVSKTEEPAEEAVEAAQ